MYLRCPSLAAHLDAGNVTVTPNRLTATVGNAQFVRTQIHSGRQSWRRPTVVSVNAWLTSLWQEARYSGLPVPSLLSPTQEAAIWRQLFSEHHPELFDLDAAARAAMGAAQTLAEWHIPLDADAWGDSRDASHFRNLYREFRNLCGERNWLARAELWHYAPQWIAARTAAPVLFAGFTAISPGLQSITGALGTASNWAMPDFGGADFSPVLAVQCDSVAHEIETAARRARYLLEKKPDISVGVLVANLREHRVAVESIFDSVFYPTWSALGPLTDGRNEPDTSRVFHLAAAESLTAHPIVASALLLLEAVQTTMPASTASALFRSPFLKGSTSEGNARALADANLRQRRDLRVTLGQLISRAAQCPAMLQIAAALEHALRERPATNSFSGWGDWISDLLESVGWPGDEPLSTRERAVLDAWQDVVSQFTSLTHIHSPVPWPVAFGELRRLVAASSCPDRGDWFSPVQILDADASAGIGFDAALVIGFSDGVWPVAERGQPFVPLSLRRRAAIPGSSAPDLRRLREDRARAILTSASDVLVTFTGSLTPLAKRFVNHAGRDALRTHERMDWTANSLPISLYTSPLPLQSFSVEPLDRIQDDLAPPLNNPIPLHGGVSIIKAQSICPFQAFARFRLLAGGLEEASFGIDARDRGGFLHKTLELVWRKLGNSAALASKSHVDLAGLVHDAVNEAVADDLKSPFQKLLRQTERERLESTVIEWLQLEKTRKIAFEVEFVEEKRSIELAGLPLAVRVDRVDRLPNGKLVLIDYKSGADVSSKHLCGERPREPQLLVYALAMGDAVEGVYLAQVRARQMKTFGFASREHFPEGRKSRDAESWDSIRASLRSKLFGFAREFASGHAAVDPQAGACTYCECKLLCRVAEAGSEQDESQDE